MDSIKQELKKLCTFSNSIKITQKNVIFSYFIKSQEYWGNFQSSHGTKESFIEKTTKLILDKVIMADRQMYVRWTNVFSFATLFNTEKIRLD